MQKEENLFKKHSSSVKNFLPLRRQKFKEDYFLLTVSEITLLSTCVGYVFRFEVVDMEDNDLDGFDDKNLMPLTSLTKRVSSEVEINPNFIPEVSKKFDLNTHKLGFESNEFQQFSVIKEVEENNENMSIKKQSDKNWHKKLKDFAFQKINKFKSQFFDEEEEEENEDSENFTYSSSNSNNSSFSDHSSKSSDKKEKKQSNNENNNNNAETPNNNTPNNNTPINKDNKDNKENKEIKKVVLKELQLKIQKMFLNV